MPATSLPTVVGARAEPAPWSACAPRGWDTLLAASVRGHPGPGRDYPLPRVGERTLRLADVYLDTLGAGLVAKAIKSQRSYLSEPVRLIPRLFQNDPITSDFAPFLPTDITENHDGIFARSRARNQAPSAQVRLPGSRGLGGDGALVVPGGAGFTTCPSEIRRPGKPKALDSVGGCPSPSPGGGRIWSLEGPALPSRGSGAGRRRRALAHGPAFSTAAFSHGTK